MLLLGNMNTLDLVIMCLSHGFFISHDPYISLVLSDGVYVYVYGQYAHLSFRYFEPPRLSFNIIFYDLYDCMSTHSWVHDPRFISLCSSAILLCIFM